MASLSWQLQLQIQIQLQLQIQIQIQLQLQIHWIFLSIHWKKAALAAEEHWADRVIRGGVKYLGLANRSQHQAVPACTSIKSQGVAASAVSVNVNSDKYGWKLLFACRDYVEVPNFWESQNSLASYMYLKFSFNDLGLRKCKQEGSNVCLLIR